MKSERSTTKTDFERAAEEKQPTIWAELLAFVTYNQKWWMIPVLVVLIVVGILGTFAGSGLAPFIYTLF